MEFLVLVAAVWIVIALGRRLALALSPAGRWERRLRNAWRKLRLREVSRREADRELSRVIRLAAEAGHSPRLERFSHSPECTDTEARVAAELAIKADSEEEEDRFRKGMEAYLQRLRGEARGREQASSTPGGSRAGDSQQAKRHSFPRNRESLPELWREAGLCVACGVRNIRDHSLGGSYCWETCRPTGDDDAPPLPVNAAATQPHHPPAGRSFAIIELRKGWRAIPSPLLARMLSCGEVFQWKKFSAGRRSPGGTADTVVFRAHQAFGHICPLSSPSNAACVESAGSPSQTTLEPSMSITSGLALTVGQTDRKTSKPHMPPATWQRVPAFQIDRSAQKGSA